MIEKLAYIKSTIDRQKGTGTIEELPFAMIGEKDNQGNVVISDILYDKKQFEIRLDDATPGSLDTAVANFDGNLARQMSNHLQNKNIKNPVVIHGHTHPQHLGVDSRITGNYSLSDMNAYQQFEENVKNVNPNAQTFGMVINEFGDFNTVGFNARSNKFEKFDNIYLGQDKLPSFTKGRYFSSIAKGNAKERPASIQSQKVQSSPYIEPVSSQNVEAQSSPFIEPVSGQNVEVQNSPFIEPVSKTEIAQTGYYNETPSTQNPKPAKKSWFERFVEKVGRFFTSTGEANLETSKIYHPKACSIAKPSSYFANKLRALKQQDGVQLGND